MPRWILYLGAFIFALQALVQGLQTYSHLNRFAPAGAVWTAAGPTTAPTRLSARWRLACLTGGVCLASAIMSVGMFYYARLPNYMAIDARGFHTLYGRRARFLAWEEIREINTGGAMGDRVKPHKGRAMALKRPNIGRSRDAYRAFIEEAQRRWATANSRDPDPAGDD